MSIELYYTAPSNAVFEEIKQEAIKLWQTYDDEFKYATQKINLIKDLENIGDNYMYIYAMFDHNNQAKLYDALRPRTQKRIREALMG
ncbi:MAG TPA: hypothetical protein VN081_01570 [Dongiaceae bacterium]|nr:hypothetical protein [Dongiaceae bacterium]